MGIFLIIISLLFFADITKDTFIDKEIAAFDIGISQIIYEFRTPLLNEVMIFISYFGADFILLFSTVIAMVLSWKKHKKESFVFAIMLIFGFLLNITLKQIFQRPRPDIDPLLTLTSYSFPSGHAMNAFVFYATLAYFTYHFSGNIKKTLLMTAIVIVLILLVGISRVYLGVHYPTDVIAGYAAGLLWFVLVLVVERTIALRRLYKANHTKR
jgi:undecaprenyl-diphosphatase